MFRKIRDWIKNYFYQKKIKKDMEELRKRDPFIYD